MKTMTKRMASMALAVMMAVVMLASAVPTKAFAADPTGTLTITNSNKEFNDKTVTAWQMFSATATADGANASYTLNAEWEAFFKGNNLDDFTAKDKTGTELSNAAVDYVTKLGQKNDPNVVAFAKKAADWAKAQKPALGAKRETTAKASGGAFVAEFTGLVYGYYVVSPEGGSTDVNTQRGTDAILANVVKDTQDVALKSEYPTVEKTVNNDTHADAQIGDTLEFVLTSKVPDMTEYTNGYTFNFIDTLSKGLTLNADNINVTIGDVVLVKDVDYSVATKTVDTNKTKLTISMLEFKTRHQNDVGKEIKVTYTATINENAEVGKDDAGNSVKLEYSNDPNTTGTGSSLPDETHGYTFGFDLHKTDANGGAALAGAEFQLQKKLDGTPVKLIVENAGNDSDSAVVRPATQEEIDAPQSKAVDTVATPKSGNIIFKGLDATGYQLVEIKAPDGYNKVNTPIDVTITAQYDQAGVLEGWTVGGKPGPSVTIDVQNNKGALLPETGGMGTVIFTVAGIAIIAGGIAWKRSRRAGNDA